LAVGLLTDLRAALKVQRRVCAVMPTGAGKGQTIGAIVQGAAGKGRRVLVLAHRAELIDQLTVRDWGLEPDVIAPGHQLLGRFINVWPEAHLIGETATPEGLDTQAQRSASAARPVTPSRWPRPFAVREFAPPQ
jgi:hypothetical protein